jgi:hypothetical protein
VRIESVTVRNFRGLRRAEVAGVDSSALVTVSGPNGSGKSLLFEAITFLWRASRPRGVFVVKSLVGPWAETATVRISLVFTAAERESISVAFKERTDLQGEVPEGLTAQIVVSKDGDVGSYNTEIDSNWGLAIWREAVSGIAPFIHLDYLPADRSIQRGEQAQVNPAMLSQEQTEGLREQVFNSFVQQRQILTLSGVQPFLASLDYLDMLAEREHKEASGDFDAIVRPFKEATGKVIHRPRIDAGSPFGAVISVETPSGSLHGLDQLSSGEQEVLALMFYVRRLSATGGLLLVDEPELHLHPALQRSLFAVMENIAERAQVWIITHSPKLVTAAPLDAVLHMRPTDGTDANQLTKSSDEEARGRLLSELGVHPVDVLQSDSLVVVEGEADSTWLSAVLALPLSRSTIYVAGNALAVEATARTLQSGKALLPWIAIRDRDLLSDDEVKDRTERIPGLFVWPSRTIENELLHPPLVETVLARAGRALEVDAISAALKAIAANQRELIVADLVEAELRLRNPYQPEQRSGLLERRRSFLEAQSASVASKLSEFDQVTAVIEERVRDVWDDEWFKFMDGKRALGEFLTTTPFRTVADYISAATHALKELPAVMPPGLAALRARLAGMRGETE